ncbi:hypothetical protein VTN00DRAFT_8849 [Thermoascus crustaceus]|uniref:uncharacterized protein n=1 Tax=Thermoascus crustaceus TaxID=5088 RepID=UPI0037447973
MSSQTQTHPPLPPLPPLLTNYTNKTWHPFNCHCGAIRYRVFLPPLIPSQPSSEPDLLPLPEVKPVPVISCTCSICTSNGYLNVYPLRSEVRIQLRRQYQGTEAKVTETAERDEEEVHPGSSALRKQTTGLKLGSYIFGAKKAQHVFCLRCGSSLWIEPVDGYRGEGEWDVVAVNNGWKGMMWMWEASGPFERKEYFN